MSNSLNAASSSTPRMTHPCKYRIKSLIICVVLPLYISFLLLSCLLLFLKFLSKCLQALHTNSFYVRSHSFLQVLPMVILCTNLYYFLLFITQFPLMGSHTDSCQFIPFSLNELLVKGLVHQIWSLSVICAQFVLYLTETMDK